MSDDGEQPNIGRGAIWSAAEQLTSQGVQLVTFIAIGNLVGPAVYGAMAGGLVLYLVLAGALRDTFADAVIQRAELGRDDVETALWIQLAAGMAAAAVCAASSGPLASAFGAPDVATVLLALAPALPLLAAGNVLQNVLRRRFAFKILALRAFAVTLVSSALAVGMALSGFGLWSLIVYQIAPAVLDLALLAALAGVRVRFRFDRAAARQIWRYGLHEAGASFISGLGQQAVRLIVGVVLGQTALGLYGLARRLVDAAQNVLFGVVNGVAFPVLSRLQHDHRRMRGALVRATHYASLIVFPASLGLALIADDLVAAVLTPNWRAAVPAIQILAAFGAVIPARVFLSTTLSALGRTELVLRFELVIGMARVAAALLAALVGGGLIMVAAGVALAAFVGLPAAVVRLRELIGMRPRSYLAAFVLPAGATLAMLAGELVLLELRPFEHPLAALAAEVVVGAATFAVACLLFAPALPRRIVRHLRR